MTDMLQAPRTCTAADIMPVVGVEMIVKRRAVIQQIMREVMMEGVHYGKVPGTDKPTLLKPGAEVLCNVFGLCPVFRVESCMEDWTGEQHGGEPFFGVQFCCDLYRGDLRIATASGAANTWEKKHRWRKSERTCPNCGAEQIRKSNRPNQSAEWYCWAKQGGCGATFLLDDQRITGQKLGNVPNPDIADLHNTIVKMGQKRALTAAILIATGASDIFTQDLEDFTDPETGETHTRPKQTSAASASTSSRAQTQANRRAESRANAEPAAPAAATGDEIWPGPGQCPKCHAPEGKRHGRQCLNGAAGSNGANGGGN